MPTRLRLIYLIAGALALFAFLHLFQGPEVSPTSAFSLRDNAGNNTLGVSETLS
jgi:hypothetical protein